MKFIFSYRFLSVLLVTALFACQIPPDIGFQKRQKQLLSLENSLLQRKLTERSALWLSQQQRPTGAWGQFQPDIGITALAMRALHRVDPIAYKEQVEKSTQLLLSRQVKEGPNKGAFSDVDGKYLNYRTCVAIVALHELDPVKHRQAIADGQNFLTGLQFLDESNKRDYGAIGYGSKIRGDLSNTQFALEALAETGFSPSDPVFQRARGFLLRLQNYKEDGANLAMDGGFPYGMEDSGEGKSPKVIDQGDETWASYGSMTYAGLKSMIYARLELDDPRVQASLQWIRNNYTLDENPGLAPLDDPAKGQQGLYYYYHTFAKTFSVVGLETLQLPNGNQADWRSDLIAALAQRQQEESYWVNEASRWWERDTHLVTSYALLALTEIR